MTLEELATLFPEIPGNLLAEPVLFVFVQTLGDLLRRARRPSPCAVGHEAANHYYLKLVGPLAIHGYGLSTREKVLGQIRLLLDSHAADPQGFAASLIPADAADREIRGPNCG